MNPILWLCFTISGGAAVALEMLWMRSASLVLGQTAATTATVLACYFGGFGLGAAAARNVRQRGVRTYGWLEIGAGAGALWSVGVFDLLGSDRAQHWLASAGLAGCIAGIAAAVVPATVCLGATLPALGQGLAAPGPIGRRGGFLYALNTLGGAAGIGVAGFGLPALIGVRACYAAAAAASALAGVAALAAGRRQPRSVIPEPIASRARSAVSRRRLRIVAAGAGALGLGLEVLWTRLFAQVLHNSVYSFSAIALVFLVAIAAGAAAAALLLRRSAPAAIAGTALIGGAVATVIGFRIFMQWTDGLAYIGMHTGLAEYVARIVALAAVCVGPAACASGVVLPALWAAWGGDDAAARPLGDLSAANTFGAIGGAVAAGFVAVPVLGVHGSLLGAAAAYIGLAHALAPHGRRRWLVASVALLVVVLVNPLRAPLVHLRRGTETLRAAAEGPSGIVSVVETDDDLQLRLDNYYVLGGTAAAANERRLGFVPLLLHPAPHRALFVGLATGITASAAPALGIDETTVVEVVPEVAEAARSDFANWNGHLLDRHDVRLVLGDGRRYLAASRERFDVIVSDLFIPWHAGAGNLYSQEMYATVARHLAPGGLFCQWLPLYQLTRQEFDIIARTFLTVFPHTSLWRADFYPDRAVVGLVGQLTPHTADLDRIGSRLEQLPPWSRDPLLAAPRAVAMLYVGNLAAAADLFAGAPLNTDDRPRIEFTAPRLTRLSGAGDKDWFTGEELAAFYDTLAARDRGAAPMFWPSDGAAQARRAGTALYHYALAASQHDDAAATRHQAEVRALVPEVIAAAEAAQEATSLRDAQHALAGLQAEEKRLRERVDETERRLGALTAAGEGSR